MERTRNSAINAVAATVAQTINVVITFVSRRIFLMMLGETLLGINSLFTQILSMMSLVELGIGPAIVYSLYRPLAENDREQIGAIMRLYKKIYTILGFVILGIGLCLTPFIKSFITGDISNVENIHLIFFLFVLNSSFSYFNSYKQNLIIADQKKYITIIYHYGLYVAMNILQIAVLVVTKNFILYLVIQIIFTLLENILLSIKTKKMYPYLKEYKDCKIDEGIMKNMKRNVKALVFHKVGGVCVSSTDSLIISKFIGIVTVGMYTNYVYVTNAFSTLITQLFSSITSSVGNFNAQSTQEESFEVFKKVYYFNFLLMGVISVCVYCLISDFIAVVFGENMLLSQLVVTLLVLKFYMTGMRSSLLTFKEAMGIYHEDRFRPLAEGLVNLAVSIILAPHLELVGVLIGTICSHLFVNMWIEPLVLYRNGFGRKTASYFISYTVYLLSLVGVCAVTMLLSSWIAVTSFWMLIVKAVVVGVVSLTLIIIVSLILNKKEFLYYLDLFKKIIKRRAL